MLSRRSLLCSTLLAPLAFGCRSGHKLALYNWGDYLAPELIDQFTQRMRDAGKPVELVQDFFLAEAELVAKLKAGAAYDIALPIDYLLSSMQRDGLLHAIDPQPAGIEHLAPDMRPWVAKPERGGGVYGIPYLWGTTGIGLRQRAGRDADQLERTVRSSLRGPHFRDRQQGRRARSSTARQRPRHQLDREGQDSQRGLAQAARTKTAAARLRQQSCGRADRGSHRHCADRQRRSVPRSKAAPEPALRDPQRGRRAVESII